MRPYGLTITSGGVPTDRQMAALAGGLATLLAAERAPAPDPLPPAYRSRWRRAAAEEAVAARRRP